MTTPTNPTKIINVIGMGDADFEALLQDPNLDRVGLREMLLKGTDGAKREVERIEGYTESLMNQSMNFMILGSLITLIILGAKADDFLPVYLSSVVWYFFAAIIVYYLSTSRGYVRITSFPTGIPNSNQELKILKAESEVWQEIATKLSKKFDRIITLLICNKILVMSFIISFSVHFYIFIFKDPPLTIREEIWFNVSLVALGAVIYMRIKSKSKSNSKQIKL